MSTKANKLAMLVQTPTANKNPYRESTLGWYLWEAGWRPVQQQAGHPLWTCEFLSEPITASEAWRLVVISKWGVDISAADSPDAERYSLLDDERSEYDWIDDE